MRGTGKYEAKIDSVRLWFDHVEKSKEGKTVDYIICREINGETIKVGRIKGNKIENSVRQNLESLIG